MKGLLFSWVGRSVLDPSEPSARACCRAHVELLEGLVLLIPQPGGCGKVSRKDRLVPAISLVGRREEGGYLQAALPFSLCIPGPSCPACPHVARQAQKH